MYNKIQAALVVIMMIIITAIIVFYMGKEDTKEPELAEYEEVEFENEFSSGWLPYWDYSNAKLDWLSGTNQGDDIVSFGVLYKGSELYVPEETDNMTKELVSMERETQDVYLSFVNDVYQSDGQVIQKDVEFLWEFLPDESTREPYIEDILDMAIMYGVDGIEIDFENLKKDEVLWGYFAEFIDEINMACLANDLKLRVVLSYDSAKYATFPQGPMYVIMCYNLFGPHSGPGPKADKDFLEQTFEINEVLKPNVSMAFANNGFAWDDNNSVTAVTKRDAIAVAKLYDVQIERDLESMALKYTYVDGQGGTNHVWFADDTTISEWKQWATQAGYLNHAIWRYGQ